MLLLNDKEFDDQSLNLFYYQSSKSAIENF